MYEGYLENNAAINAYYVAGYILDSLRISLLF